MSARVRCAIAGLGLMGAMYASILSRLGEAEVVVCLDPLEVQRAKVPPGCRFVTTVDELFETEFDLLLVCTPEDAHRDLVLEGLRRNLVVFVEKPIANNEADAIMMVEADDASTGTLVVGHTLRLDPRYALLASRVASGELGQSVHTVSRRSNPVTFGRHLARRTTLPLYLSIHDFDVTQWIVGSRIVRVYAEAVSRGLTGGPAPDAIVATLRFADGSVGVHETNWALAEHSGFASGDFAFSFVGSDGSGHIQIRSQGLEIYGGAHSRWTPAAGAAERMSANPGFVERPDTSYLTDLLGAPDGVYPAEMRHLLRVCLNDEQPLMTSREALSALQAVLALEASLTSGAPADVSEKGL